MNGGRLLPPLLVKGVILLLDMGGDLPLLL